MKKKKTLSPHDIILIALAVSERSTGVQNVRGLLQRLRIQGASGDHLQSQRSYWMCLKMGDLT